MNSSLKLLSPYLLCYVKQNPQTVSQIKPFLLYIYWVHFYTFSPEPEILSRGITKIWRLLGGSCHLQLRSLIWMSIIKCEGQSPTIKNHLNQNLLWDEVGKPCPNIIQGFIWDISGHHHHQIHFTCTTLNQDGWLTRRQSPFQIIPCYAIVGPVTELCDKQVALCILLNI